MNIQNGTWTPIDYTFPTFLFLIFLTILIESGIVFVYGRKKGIKDLDNILILIFFGNIVTGIMGLIFRIIFLGY